MQSSFNEADEFFQNTDPFSFRSGSVVYMRKHSLNIFISDKPGFSQKLPNKQELLVKIAVQGTAENPRLISIQLSSDSQLEFNFQFRCNDMDFRRIKQIQKFYIQFREYPEIIAKNFEKLVQKNEKSMKYQGNFTIFSQNEGRLEIIRKSEFKDDLIMEFSFSKSPEEHIQQSVQYRYSCMKRQYKQKAIKYEQYRQIIRAKNPSLLIQIDKSLKTKK